MDFIAQLKGVLGRDLLTANADIKRFARDESPLQGSVPIAVAVPRNTLQVSKIMEICSRENVQATVRGGGSSLTGSSVPRGRSIVIDMSKFNRILEANIEDRYVVAEPDVRIDQLNRHLQKHNYFYPPDPGSSKVATVGGTISTNAGGLRAVKYGTTKQWVLGLEVVLPSGRIIHTGGKVLKRSIGYDLTALMVASEGTLGIITKAILAIWPMPESVAMVTAYFQSIEDAGRATSHIKRRGITPLAAEFIDSPSMKLMEASRHLEFPKKANYMLFIEVGSAAESIPRLVDIVGRTMKECKSSEVYVATSKYTIASMYEARKYLFLASEARAKRQGKKVIIADIVVPASRVPAALREMKQAIGRSKLEAVMFGHIGDGNVHANILYKDSKQDRRRMEELQHELAMIAIRHEGSVSGEHGIGLIKKGLLREEFKARGTLENITLMKGIKQVFDPDGILNKGKIFD